MIYTPQPNDQDFTKIHRHSPALFYEEQIYVTNANHFRYERHIGVYHGVPVCEAPDAKTCMEELVTYIDYNKWWYPGDLLEVLPWLMGPNGNHGYTLRGADNHRHLFRIQDLDTVANIYNKIVNIPFLST